MRFVISGLVAAVVVGMTSSSAQATFFTRNSPTGGTLPAAVTEVGGIVLDFTGANGTRVVTQLAASSLFVGFNDINPQPIGTQTGFTSAVTSALGGGISSLSVRVTLSDGDSSAGNFDFNDDTFRINGVSIGNFSSVLTQITNSTGLVAGTTQLGFPDNQLATGFFTLSGPAANSALASIFASLTLTEAAAFSLTDVDPGDNFFDFTQGVDGGLINVGTGPIVTPGNAVPAPAGLMIGLVGFGFAGLTRRVWAKKA